MSDDDDRHHEDINLEEQASNSASDTDLTTNRRPTWWMRFSIMEIVLTVFIVTAVLVIIILAATRHITVITLPASNEDTRICMTSDCVHTASRMLKNMDPEIKPCDNFYRFACGNFIHNKNVPPGESFIDTFSMIRDNFLPQFRVIFGEPILPEEPKPFASAKQLYKACMNKSLVESRGVEPFLKILDSFGGWPVLTLLGENWNEGSFSWKTTLIQFKKKGFNFKYFIKLSIGTYYNNPYMRTLKLDELNDDDFGNIRDNLKKGIEDPIVIAYYNYMVDIAVLLGAPTERAESEMKELLLFEIKLANILTPLEERLYPNPLPNHYTIAEMQIEYPIINWEEYINALLPPGLMVDEDEVISVEEHSHLKEIERILRKSPKRVIANYLMWKIISENMGLLTADFREREAIYKADVQGKPVKVPPRWKYCTGLVKERFIYALNLLYVRKYFYVDAKNDVLQIVNRIKNELVTLLKNADWMEGISKLHADIKASTIRSYIGYPEETLDVSKLEEYYKDVQIDENKFMETVLNMKVFTTNKDFSKLKEPRIRKENWTIHNDFTKIEPFFQSVDNSINFPLGMLQNIYFSADRPQYMNYGAIGFLIGHHLTHGFNERGRLFDVEYFRRDWWTIGTEEEYLKRVRCFNEQYGNYTVKEVNLNVRGINTQEENVADNGGVKEAYLAYTKWVEENGVEEQLPGLNYTPRQLFWLSAATTWCSKYTPEAMKIYIKDNKHAPPEFRVVGPLSNSEDFAKDFQCPPGSPMNPQRKCKIF